MNNLIVKKMKKIVVKTINKDIDQVLSHITKLPFHRRCVHAFMIVIGINPKIKMDYRNKHSLPTQLK